MDPAQANTTHAEALVPDDVSQKPHVTIRSQADVYLVYDIDPNQLPTGTITRGGHRILLDDSGALHESPEKSQSFYEVIEKISEGGMGIIYAVRDNSLKRDVALKICRLDPRADFRGPLGEFINEAYMTARLDHPGVVPIYALAKDADGRPFFAMKKVSGTSWKDLLHPEAVADPVRREAIQKRARQMTWKDHLDVLLRVCNAVAYAHSKAILHRDLKPDNVMLGDYGEAYVMDWGLAMYFDERNEYKRFPGLKPQLAGTPSYIAPEMVRGKMTRLCPATDVYLLGGILYEILTGRPPHAGDSVMDVLKQAAEGVVPPPEEVSDSPVINPILSRIVQKALARRIPDRYPSVTAFQQDIRDYLVHSESMVVCQRAAELLAGIHRELGGAEGASPEVLDQVDKEAAAIHYGKLSECIGGFRQAIELWRVNEKAWRGLLEALALQIRLAVRQDDLMLARAQHRLLKEMKRESTDTRLVAEIDACAKDLAGQIESRQAWLNRTARQARGWKATAVAMGLLLLAGVAGIVYSSFREQALAVRDQKNMFEASVVGRAQMLEQFIYGIEQIATLYRQTAVELMSSPPERLPWRAPTPAGRDGFYFDEDFYDRATRPAGLAFSPRYQADLSMDYPTVVRSPWARDEAHRAAVEDAAARLGRLNSLFLHIHRIRRDIQWSIAGSEAGLLVGYPGSGRYRDKPDYDATRRMWYLAAIQVKNDRPVWGDPYADATTRLILMSCMCRINVNGRNAGVVGVEITLNTLQRILLDFSQSLGGVRRGLLIRPFEETDAVSGETKTVPRVMVDTLYPHAATDWQSRLEMATVDEAGEEIASYYREVMENKHRPGVCHEAGKYWLAHMPVKNRAWTFIAILERGEKDR